ncbi:sugar transferase [uncultured Polaribacter sp.]|uniref:sugar transferase n=1 Tax=uncultured Polaribacter sp. TaxID=174711 RepID=UPI00260FCA7E|nr:sugar transferase [uncultured Polaribacter sp.]
MYQFFFKRFFDVIIALGCLLLFLPLLLVIYIILLVTTKGTPFFSQDRPGKNDKIFKVYKFRTMNTKKDLDGNLLPDKDRLTKIGMLLRKTSLDESPQVINVLKGDMSIIGPRPLLPEYLSLYNKEQLKRHLVKPGITGWAQINGRNAISWKQKFEYDIWYTKNLSFQLDFKIFLITVGKVFKSENINEQGQATAAKFRGNIS